MAFKRLAFGTHQRDPMVLASRAHPLKPRAECLGLRETAVLYPSVLVTGLVLAPCPELLAQEHVGDAMSLQRSRQRLPVELGLEAAVWNGSHIGDRGHPMLVQQIY